jgi:hypothetical protein
MTKLVLALLLTSIGCTANRHLELEAYNRLKTIGIALRDYDKLNGGIPKMTGNQSEFDAIASNNASWRASLLNRLVAIPKNASNSELQMTSERLFTVRDTLLICGNFEGNGESLRKFNAFKVVLFTRSHSDDARVDFLTSSGEPMFRTEAEKLEDTFTFVLFANGNVAKVPREHIADLLNGKLPNSRQELESRGISFIGPEFDDFRTSMD